MTKTIALPVIEPGTMVGVVNCVGFDAKVIERVRKNVYRIEWRGRVMEVPRTSLILPRN